jgi:hypothetical protein
VELLEDGLQPGFNWHDSLFVALGHPSGFADFDSLLSPIQDGEVQSLLFDSDLSRIQIDVFSGEVASSAILIPEK